MSFPRYPEYKASGVDWLGDVPEHWKLSRLKNIANITGGGTPSREKIEYWNGDIPWVSPKDMKSERVDSAEESITQLGLENSTTSLYPVNSVLMVIRSGILQHTLPVAINEVSVAINQDLKALVFDKSQCETRFFLRWIQGLNDHLILAWASEGATVESINQPLMQNSIVPLPSFKEQQAIADFLDRETAKIDGLIEEQRRLVELLKEKRQAVISHAVTKGLNPNAPMKPSGIEWLGDIPEHWELVSAKRVASVFVPQRNKPDLNSDGNGHFWVTMEQMRNEEINSAEMFVSTCAGKDVGTRVLSSGAVIASCVGNFGLASINKVDVIINQQLQAFIPTTHIDARFMRHCVVIAKPYFEQIGTSATITYVNQLGFANMPIVLPPNEEQHEIVANLAHESAKFNTLISETEKSITLLQERRTALISAAVTGKIDVRGLIHTESKS